jgi:S-adenosyl-L-methionine hydrolase (adenosine-forming)
LVGRTGSAPKTSIGSWPTSTTALAEQARGPISFLSDYGLTDEFVGVVHRVINGIAPGTPIADLTHQIPPHDVRAGALALWRSAPWLAPGVVLAVVDPGVGTKRRPVAIATEAGAVLVGPDNGLLLPAALRLGPITVAVELEKKDATERGSTFDGRDLFGPAASRIATGVDMRSLGAQIEPGSLRGDPVPEAEREAGGAVRTEVLWVDRFGNAQLNVRPPDVSHLGSVVDVRTRKRKWRARRVSAYGDLRERRPGKPAEVGLVHDSYGFLSISLNRESAAAFTGLRTGQTVWLTPRE